MTGGLLISTGAIATSFTTSVNQIYVTYGLVAGIGLLSFFEPHYSLVALRLQKSLKLHLLHSAGFGYCLTFLPTVTILSQYFTRRRALVTAVASTGESLFMSALAPGACAPTASMFLKGLCKKHTFFWKAFRLSKQDDYQSNLWEILLLSAVMLVRSFSPEALWLVIC